jgi:hypothetical protein
MKIQKTIAQAGLLAMTSSLIDGFTVVNFCAERTEILA